MWRSGHARSLVAWAGAALATIATPAAALSPTARSFLVAVGIDPDSPAVKIADADGKIHTTFQGDAEVLSLEKLALGKRANGARQFIFMRSLIREIKANYASYRVPPGGYPDYNALYLTPEERLLVGRKVAESLTY